MLQIERSAKRPSRAIGFLAALRAFPHAQGSGAPACIPVTVAFFVTVLASLALTAAPALAAAPTVTIAPVTSFTATTAQVSGTVNPNGGPTTVWDFQYSKDPEAEGWTPSAVAGPALGSEGVSGTLEGLQPGSSYQVRLVATNEAGEEAISAEPNPQFTTGAAPPKILSESESVSEVTNNGATLGAEIVPRGGATTYHFEYDTTPYTTDAPHGTSTPESASIGSDSNPHPVSEPIQPLLPGTEYHYRVVAHNPAGGGAGSTVYGPDQTFATQGTATGFRLPDGRGWEQVSPVDKYGAELQALTDEGGVIEAAADGSAITYVASAPAVSEPAGNVSDDYTQMLSARGEEGGWGSRDIATPHEEAAGVEAGYLTEYKAFSPDLKVGLVEPGGEPDVSPLSAPAKERSIYLREGLLEGEGATLYTPLVDDADVTPGTHYGKETKLEKEKGKLTFVASTENAEHVVFESIVPLLTPNAEAHPGIYEWSKGSGLRPVSILPDGTWVPLVEARLGDGGVLGDTRNAISSDGQYVFFTARAPEFPHLFRRDVIGETTTRIDAAQGIVEPSESEMASSRGPQFQDATPDGARVYFTDELRLTPSSTAEPNKPELYEYNFDKPAGAQLTDLTPNPEGPGSSSIDVQGNVIGVTEHGEDLYFVANGELTKGEGAVAGNCESNPAPGATCNLYMEHVEVDGNVTKATPTFIAALSAEDEHDWQTQYAMSSRMSPNGRYLAFMSDRSLTGYDNTDAGSPAPCGQEHGICDEEVYLYNSSTGRLACASCDPTGARPHGVLDTGYAEVEAVDTEEGLGLLVDRPEQWGGRWLAGSVPGWTRWGVAEAQYQSRYLSDEGRLFFDAADALVPQDTNGKEDVYEYEPEHVGGQETPCGEAAESGSEVFKHEHPFTGAGAPGGQVTGTEPGGCVGLISSGTSTKESAFLDASESGDDVFFLTASPLSLSDSDQSYDVYDAHSCTTASPCASTAVVASPPCTTADSCRAASTPQPAIFGAPASATFAGAGNAAPSPAMVKKVTKKTVKCKKGYVKNKKNKCVKKAKKKSKKAKKAGHGGRTKS